LITLVTFLPLGAINIVATTALKIVFLWAIAYFIQQTPTVDIHKT